MKKAFSLVEVLVAVALISVVIATTLQLQQNNLHILDTNDKRVELNSYFSLVSNTRDKDSFRVDDVIKFKDDDIRKEFKDIKVKLEKDDLDPVELPQNDYIKTIQITEYIYTIDGKQRKFMRFSL